MKIGAFAIILNDSNQVLLSHRKDLWNLPGIRGALHEIPRSLNIYT
jgi:hypothetical protein